MSNLLPFATSARASSGAGNIARSFSEITTGVRDRARSNSHVRRHSKNAGGAEVSLWRTHTTFPKPSITRVCAQQRRSSMRPSYRASATVP